MTGDLLTRRALNRATLERQLLLRRSDVPVLDAVEHLVGLQAQLPLNPYTALWSRLAGFEPESLARLLLERRVVRIVVMRATIHLVSAEDSLLLRPLMQPVLDAELARHREYGPVARAVDVAPVVAFARTFLAERPATGVELRAAIAERFPGLDATALAYACRNLLPLVQVPPRGVWGETAQVRSTTLESWLGRPLDPHPSLDDVVLRYLGAFGPALAGDIAAWSRLTGFSEVVERLRPRLRTFRDEQGRELLDLPDAPRPDPDTPAPPRFLPEYDNALLSHADRSRFMSPEPRARLGSVPGPIHGSVLSDGFGAGVWRREPAGLAVLHAERLPRRAQEAIAAEGRRLLGFVGADPRDVRFVPVR